MSSGTLRIKSAYIINPFFWYSIIWLIVLILYNLDYSELYEPLHQGLFVFILSTILIAFAIGIIFQRHFKKIQRVNIRYKTKYLSVCLIVVLFIIEFIYCGYIPFFNPRGYYDFGIPTIHVICVTYAVYIYICIFKCVIFFKSYYYYYYFCSFIHEDC